MEVVHNRCPTHESVVDSFVIDCRRFGPTISAVMAENECSANRGDSSGVTGLVSTNALQVVYVRPTRELQRILL